MKGFKLVLMVGALSLMAFSVFAQEENSSEKETGKEKSAVTVTPNFSMQQRLKVQTRGLEAVGNDIGDFEDPFYSRTNFFAGVDIAYNHFHFVPYFFERFEMFLSMYDFQYENEGESKSLGLVDFHGRNRAGMGAYFNYINPNIINVVFDFNHIIQASFKKAAEPKASVQYFFQPMLELSGSYDFGLSWSALCLLRFVFNEGSFSTNADKPLVYGLYVASFSLEYEFLHLLNPDSEHKFSLFTEGEYGFAHLNVYGPTLMGSFDGNTFFGVKYRYKYIAPKLGIAWVQDFDDGYASRRNSCGLVTGFNFKMNQYKLDVNYIGVQQTTPGGDGRWQSELQGIFTISF